MAFIKSLIALFVSLALYSSTFAAETRPNILFLFADDQRADTIAALGNPIIKTPNLDRLVHAGVSFNCVIRYPQIGRTQLFDLRADPQETTNLAGEPEQANRVAQLTDQLEAQQVHFGDIAPLHVANPRPADWSPPGPAKP